MPDAAAAAARAPYPLLGIAWQTSTSPVGPTDSSEFVTAQK